MKKTIFFTFCIIVFFYGNTDAQIIRTVAGKDTAGYNGDGIMATSAWIQGPYGVTTDALGNIYIADQYNNRVRKVNASGTISTVAGNGTAGFSGDSGPATAATLNQPTGVAVDEAGNVYISDMMNNCIRKVNSSGIISTYAGHGLSGGYSGDGGSATGTLARLSQPMGLAIDLAGNLFITDFGNNVIREVTASGIINTVAGSAPGFGGDGGPATNASMDEPLDVAVDATGNLYIADYFNNRIRKVDVAGVMTTCAGNGSLGASGDGGQATTATLNRPTGVKISASGVLFITDGANNKIRNVYPTGVIYTLAGNGTAGFSGDGGLARYAELSDPYGGALDHSGHYYTADYQNSRIRMMDTFINHSPAFAAGHVQHLNVCHNTVGNPINTLLNVNDIDTTQTENWFIVHNPVHGTLSATYSAVSTGSTLTPVGLAYTPTTGYVGVDTFKVGITDGINFDTTTVSVTVQTQITTAGIITGVDSVCPGDSVLLTDATSGGVWTTSNSSISTVSGSGMVHGIALGTDSVIYTISNSCNSVLVYYQFHVKSLIDCNLSANKLAETVLGKIELYPNPNTGNFVLQLTTGLEEHANISITNMLGEKVNEFTIVSNKATDLNLQLSSGIYIITATTANNSYSARVNVVR